ncbi:MAG: nucleotide sugar dehydrogenase [Myxococcota bacterium]
MSTPKVGFLGLSHLGICSAVAAAERGFQIVGIDPDPTVVDALRSGKPSVQEPDLPELMRKNFQRLRFSHRPEELARCALVYVSTDVPTDGAGRSDLRPIEELLRLASASMASGTPRIILSQVPPGFTRRHREASRPLYCQVETLIFGRAMERALAPERIIVGCEVAGEPLPAAYGAFLARFGCPIHRMAYESAELAKIAINLYLVASITMSNMLAEICEGIGATWSDIVPALRSDRRIGEHAYLAPGLGIGGGNLERDLLTVQALAQEAGAEASVIRACLSNSRHRRDWSLRILHEHLLPFVAKPVLAVLGLAYKPDTASTRNSPALALIDALPPLALRVYDPVVSSVRCRRGEIHSTRSALEACRNADAVAIMTPWPEFSEIDLEGLVGALRGKIVLDPFGVLDADLCADSDLRCFTLGAAPPGTARTRGGEACA